MLNIKSETLIFILSLVITSCVKCDIIYRSKIEPANCKEITRLTAVVDDDASSGITFVNVDIEWCNSYGKANCCDKRILSSSVEVTVSASGEALDFSDKKEGVYQFESQNEKLIRKNDVLDISLSYRVDSLGVELFRHHYFVLLKDKECGFAVH